MLTEAQARLLNRINDEEVLKWDNGFRFEGANERAVTTVARKLDLRGLIKLTEDGSYRLTDEGKVALNSYVA